MKFTRQQEINDIINESQSFDELNRLSRLFAIFMDEISKISSNIFIVGAKVDKLRKELNYE